MNRKSLQLVIMKDGNPTYSTKAYEYQKEEGAAQIAAESMFQEYLDDFYQGRVIGNVLKKQRTMVPMPPGVVLSLSDAGNWKQWLHFVMCGYRVERRGKVNPITAFRRAIWGANHGRYHTGEDYRSCYRLKWIEP